MCTGGFGGAPKFPPSMALEFLLRHAARSGSARSREMVAITCERMARGGMYDQLAGGFARYSVDAGWVVPHFEKMLYDNALLARVYVHWWRLTGDPLARRIAIETCDWMLTDLLTAGGRLRLVARCRHRGSRRPVLRLDARTRSGRCRRDLRCHDGGTFEDGTSVLQLLARPGRRRRSTQRSGRACSSFASQRAGLVGTTRWSRPGTALRSRLSPRSACCSTGPTWSRRQRVRRAAVDRHLVDGRLRRVSRGRGRRGAGRCARGLWRRGGGPARVASGDRRAALARRRLASCSTSRLRGSATATAGSSTPPTTPSGWCDGRRIRPTVRRRRGSPPIAAALFTSAALTGRAEHRDAASTALGTAANLVERFPRFAGWSAAACGGAARRSARDRRRRRPRACGARAPDDLAWGRGGDRR